MTAQDTLAAIFDRHPTTGSTKGISAGINRIGQKLLAHDLADTEQRLDDRSQPRKSCDELADAEQSWAAGCGGGGAKGRGQGKRGPRNEDQRLSAVARHALEAVDECSNLAFAAVQTLRDHEPVR